MDLFEFVEIYLKKKKNLKGINYSLVSLGTQLYVNKKILDKMITYSYVEKYNIELNKNNLVLSVNITFARGGGPVLLQIPLELYV